MHPLFSFLKSLSSSETLYSFYVRHVFLFWVPLHPRVASNFHIISQLKEFGARREKGVLSPWEQLPLCRWPGNGCGLMAAHARPDLWTPEIGMGARGKWRCQELLP